MNKIGILVLGNELNGKKNLDGYFLNNGYDFHFASDPIQAYTIMEENSINIVVVDQYLNGKFGSNFLKSFTISNPEIETFMLTDDQDGSDPTSMKKNGQRNFATKPLLSKNLKKIIEESRTVKKFKKVQAQLDNNLDQFTREMLNKNVQPILGNSAAIKTIVSLILLVAKSEDTSVIITGESGTGKELIARGIHAMSNRNSGPFNAVNCSAIPDSLFESEFFGFRKGAFTGAMEKSMGWFELANNGTLFLDEVTELPPLMQGKLLRVLDDKTIYKIGSRTEVRLNLRVVSATNKDIHQLLDRNTLRLDLFHRLNSFHIHIPPLRERKEDIPVLLNYFISEFSKRQNKPVKEVERNVMDKLLSHPFPGNVRELKNMAERAVILSDEPVLRLRDFNISTERKPGAISNPLLRTLNLHEVERRTISDALLKTSFNVSRAAAMLSISRQRLYRKMEKLRINFREFSSQ
jgi:DNA-binding NtrC family response regulator